MQEQSVLQTEQPDPEVFRRVWDRVMQGREDSPIQVEPPAEAAPQETVQEKLSEQMPAPSSGKPSPAEQLGTLMELAREGAVAGQLLARRIGSQGKPLMDLAADHRTALRRLGAAYFLETGEHYVVSNPRPNRGGALDQALREQFLWERNWEKVCQQAADQMEETGVSELCQELAQDGALHSRWIRRLLERM